MSEFANDRGAMHEGAIASVKRKLASGEYPLETQACFCGADDDQEIKTMDRLGIPHRIVVCKNCAIARATPRMTQAAYESYYNNEYRQLEYRGAAIKADSRVDELESVRQHEYKFGHLLIGELINEDIEFPKVVVDFGCYMGGALDRFEEGGAATYGVEYNDEARAAARSRHHPVFKTIEELIELGVKADLVIMHDVVEHLMDLNEVHKLRLVMKPDAYLYMFTPGLFRTDPAMYWQLAHTYYFVASTLNWAMNRMGYDATYIDEDISSFWQYTGNYNDTNEPPREWVDYIADEADGKEDRKLPPFRGVCKFTKKLLYDNMRRNFAMRFPDIHAITGSKSGSVIIIGGGPSIDGQWNTIKALHDQATPVITIARMYPACIAHGVIPDYVVSLDCSEEQEKGFVQIGEKTTHLMATVTRPEILEMIERKGAPIYVFDSRDDRKIKGLRRDAGYEVATVINSGGTVVITCMSVAFNLGFSSLDIFGLDLMFADPAKFHAAGIAGQSVDQRVLTVTIDGKDLLTTPSFIEFARQALDLIGVAKQQGMLESVKFHGESMCNYLWNGDFIDEAEAA